MTYPNSYVARVVEIARKAHGNTQRAIDAAAESLDLSPEQVAQIAADETQAVAARITAVTAASLGLTPELADAGGCRGCGACQREPVEA